MKEFTPDRVKVNRAFPFMQNFPFNEDFEIEIANHPVLAMMYDEDFETSRTTEPRLINFAYKGTPTKVMVSILNNELEWISEKAENITKLDKISKRINRGLRSHDILLKRDISIEADEWLKQVSDRRSSLSQETFNEVIQTLLSGKSLAESAGIIRSINKLYAKKGVLKLSEHNLNIIYTYLHFRLVYTKLILGIVIASKISL